MKNSLMSLLFLKMGSRLRKLRANFSFCILMHSSACVANDSAPSRASPLLSDRERMYLAFVSSFPRRIHSVLYRDNIMCRMRKIISVRAVFFASKLWQNFSVSSIYIGLKAGGRGIVCNTCRRMH